MIREPGRLEAYLLIRGSADLRKWRCCLFVIAESAQMDKFDHCLSVCVCVCHVYWDDLSVFSSRVSSPQSSEQEQTPGPPRASLPVQPQTGTAVSTPFLCFHPSIQSSHSPCHFPSPLMCYVIHPNARPRCCVRTFIGVEGSNPLPWWHSAALCCCGEVKKSACQHRCARFLRGERAPGVSVLLGPVRNFYSETQVSHSVRAGHADGEKTPTCSFHSLSSLPRFFLLPSQVFYLFYPRRIPASWGWRLKHLHFIAVFIGLPSSPMLSFDRLRLQ